METLWITVKNQEGYKPQPDWVRTAGIDVEGAVWVPAVIAGAELTVFLMASYDNEPITVSEDHLYVRAEWMKREIPAAAELCDKITLKCRYAQKLDSASTESTDAQ